MVRIHEAVVPCELCERRPSENTPFEGKIGERLNRGPVPSHENDRLGIEPCQPTVDGRAVDLCAMHERAAEPEGGLRIRNDAGHLGKVGTGRATGSCRGRAKNDLFGGTTGEHADRLPDDITGEALERRLRIIFHVMHDVMQFGLCRVRIRANWQAIAIT